MRAATELATQLARADARVWMSWLQAMQELPTNPYGVTIRQVGNAVALHCHAIPSTNFNRIMNVGCNDVPSLPELIEFFQVRATPVRIDFNPFSCSEDLLTLLIGLGLHPIAFQSNLYRDLDDWVPEDDDVVIAEVDRQTLDDFASIYERAYNYGRSTPPGIVSFRTASIRARWDRPDWHFYLAFVDKVPVAGAALHVDDGVATLAGGATLPQSRGMGCQSALVAYRMNVARLLNCEIVVSRCNVGSPSQRNLERAGLQTAYTKVIWAHQMVETFKQVASVTEFPALRAV